MLRNGKKIQKNFRDYDREPRTGCTCNNFLRVNFCTNTNGMKEEKILQIVNLAPNESLVERLVEIHPMKQVFWASVIQLCVFGFMLLSFWTIGLFV